MASLNKVMLIGHLGKDPEIKYMPSGRAVANFSIATKETWNDKTTGEKQERTEWHRITFFAKRAEVIGEYFKKGDPIYIEGKMQTRSYMKGDVKMYTTEVIGDNFQFISSGGSNQSARATPAREAPAATNTAQMAASAAAAADDFDDDIPF